MIKKHFTLGELIVVLGAVLLILVLILISFANQPRDSSRDRVNCNANLKQIGLALLMYSGDANGYFILTPSGNNFEPLNTLDILNDSKVFGCPSIVKSDSSNYADLATTARSSNYRYGGSGIRDDNTEATTTTLPTDRSGNHPANLWINVLFVDGHVEGSKPDGKRTWNSN